MTEAAVGVFRTAVGGGVTTTGIATIQSLLSVLQSSQATTVQELLQHLRDAAAAFRQVDCSAIQVRSTSDLFTLFITQAEHARLESEDFEVCRGLMVTRGRSFLARLEESSAKIVAVAQPFLRSARTILVHGASTTVSAALAEAGVEAELDVVVTRSSVSLVKQLQAAGLNVRVVEDLAVGAEMHKVDCVLLGAEGVVETGGIVNQLGSYTIALVARALNKQCYVLAESFKFVREYPVLQTDLPAEYLYPASVLANKAGAELPSPAVDYTPPALISLLFTDLGILTPSAVSDELINLYL